MIRERSLRACLLVALALAGCSQERAHLPPASDGSDGTVDPSGTSAPQFEVHPPAGWDQSMNSWSLSTSDGEFSFTDMSYVSDLQKFDSAVYVCVEMAHGRACSSRPNYVILDEVHGRYRVTVALEEQPGEPIDHAVMRAWSDVQIDFH